MTQLIIAGVETVLPQSFSVTVKRENSFFTKSGEYTYDCTLRLDNPVNQQLYGFLHRLNKTGQVATRRTAILMADGHVYCRGTEVITKWTDQTVSIQIVSGNSELNYFVGQEQKIEDLNLGNIGTTINSLENHWPDPRDLPINDRAYGDSDFCLPPVRTGDIILNLQHHSVNPADPGEQPDEEYWITNAAPQPYLCALLRRLIGALGYTVGTNHLEQTQFRNLFLVNTVRTAEYAKMLPGWTVKDFLTEVEKLCGIVFVTDNTDPQNLRTDILLKTLYYQDARQLPLSNVVDEYEMEVNDDDADAEWSTANVTYELPESEISKLMKLPEGYEPKGTITHNNLYEMLEYAENFPDYFHKVVDDDRLYIYTTRQYTENREEVTIGCLVEVDQFRDLKRQDAKSQLELKITPAPMQFYSRGLREVITLPSATTETITEEDEDTSIEQRIKTYANPDSQATDLYCAFYADSWLSAYTDGYHATLMQYYYPVDVNVHNQPQLSASLRLADLDADYYQGGYQIDTAHAVTFQTFDPNHIDPRQVYVIQNRRYVVRDVEETVTAEGRSPLWRVTCYPIKITDESIEHRWVLTRGTWDDGAAWIDDGRWNDTDPQQ